ncbi:MAG: hypothetical protein QMD12_02230 [Candidatus Aenigmarchaeota archaeon]|nr:hypothetical protein [Candidatus Aenigmarchaeota archaeon]
MVIYPEGPLVRRWREGLVPVLPAGKGINAPPPQAEILLDFTAPLGKMTGIYYGLSTQLPKWGFWRGKIDEWIFVSHVFREYYELTTRQKDTLEGSIKEGLRSIGVAVSDLELILHDLRKYREFLDYFTWIEKGKIEKNPELVKKGEQSLKAVFIDMVDAYTGEGIALKLIAPRWPTIIADFMKLTDEDVDPKKIAEKLKVSEAEGVVLATKNKLYVEWRDRLFKETVRRRYENLLRQAEARRKSVQEYKDMLRDKIARHKMIKDALEKPEIRAAIYKSFFRPEAQAMSIDFMRLWAWKPFAPSEKYKNVKTAFNWIHATKAGFLPREIRELERELPKLLSAFPHMAVRIKEKTIEGKKVPFWDGYVEALPVEPSIDDVLRKLIPEIELEYGVKFTAVDLFKARNMLIEQFRESYSGLGGIEPWVWSPYFVFLDIPLSRGVIKIPPAGPELENITIANLLGATQTQNIIIAHCLEFVAKDKLLDQHVSRMLGEAGIKEEIIKGVKVEKILTIEEIVGEEFPEIYLGKEKIEEEKEEAKRMEEVKPIERAWMTRQKLKEVADKIRGAIGKFFASLGWEVAFFRAIGPYEFSLEDRLAEFYQPITAREFDRVRRFIETGMEVPGVVAPW